MIPNNIFQTHKSIDYIKKYPKLIYAMNTWRNNKHFNYYFSDDSSCDIFMKLYFPEIKDVYDRLPLKVMKADLWRYCIIYKYGGIYADIDTIAKLDPSYLINQKGKDLIVVPEDNIHFCQWVFAAPKSSPILKSIIDLSVDRIRNTKIIKGDHIVHYLTGPGVFTDGILKYMNENNIKNLGNLSHDGISKYDNRNIIKYEKNFIDNMFVFKSNYFHKKMVFHIGSGSWINGWKNETNRLLK